MLISKKIDYNENRIRYFIIPEDLRIFAYMFFWFLVIIGAWLTFNYSNVNFEDNPLIHMYGYNNICILFDSFPATYILPMLWTVNFLLFFLYVTFSWFRIYQMYLFGNYPKSNFIIFSTSTIIEYIGLVFFSGVFAANPEESMLLHTVPFTFLIFALSLMGIKNYLFYRYIAKLSSLESNLGILYLIIHLTTSLIKMTMQVNGFTNDLLYTTLDYIPFNQFIDRLWMVTAVLFPLFFSFRFRKRVPAVEFNTIYKD